MSLRALSAALIVALCPFAAKAETRAAKTAEQAAADLRAAIGALQSAESGKDRIAALTRTIRAYEVGLSALREALRGAAVREAEIAAGFAARRDEIGRLLGVMTSMEQVPAPLYLLHPTGPVGTARSGLILAAVAPALQIEADRLKSELTEMRNIRALQQETSDMLSRGLTAVQDARAALAAAMQDRTDLPRRYLEDPEDLRRLVESAETLDAFAEGIAGLDFDIGAPHEDFASAEGSLPLPAFGRLLRKAGEEDAAGIARAGLLVATAPGALVTSPWPATVRYRGPLLDYGNVMILEPESGYLLVLAGLETVFGETGDVLTAGDPVGLMGGAPDSEEVGGATRSETLYIELRQDGATIDPGPWFAETKEK
jgi:septal ring factor EnvC (AmiA/AmiB activator)